jgi:hypothetical protein
MDIDIVVFSLRELPQMGRMFIVNQGCNSSTAQEYEHGARQEKGLFHVKPSSSYAAKTGFM